MSVYSGNSTANAYLTYNSLWFNSTTSAAYSIVKPAANSSFNNYLNVGPLGGNAAVQSGPWWSGLHLTPPLLQYANGVNAFPRTSMYYSYTNTTGPTDMYFNIVNGNDGGLGTGIKIYASGTDTALRGIDIAANGNVGIATASPRFKLSLGSTTPVSTTMPDTMDFGATYSSSAGANGKLRLWYDVTNYMGFGVSSNQLDYIVTNGGYDHVFYSAGTEVGRIKGSSGLYSYFAGSVRSPIFYDSDNTAYYSDPSGASNQMYLRLNGDWSGGLHLEQFTIRGVHPSLTLRATNGTKSVFLLHNDAADSLVFYSATGNTDSTGWGARFHIQNSGDTVSYVSSRAPIFYDSGDTGYYTNPNGTSVLNYTQSYTVDLYRANSARSGISYYASSYNTWDTYMGPPNVAGQGPYGTVTPPAGTYVNSWALRNVIEPSGGYGWTWETNPNNGTTPSIVAELRYDGLFYTPYLWASTDSRAPIFYDQNNTGYYVDPAGGTKLAELITFNHSYGSSRLEDGRGVVINGNYTNGYYSHRFRKWDEGNGVPMYVQYTTGTIGSWSNIAKFGPGGNGETAEFSVFGYGYASGSWRAPIFYDSDDTGYYANPNGYSQFSAILTNDWFRPQGETGVYSQSYGQHFYPDSGGYWWECDGGLRIRDGYEGGVKGHIGYHDGNGFGILNSSGNWQIRIEYGNANMELYNVTYMNDARAYIFYDRNDTGYYCDPAGTSMINNIGNNMQLFGGYGSGSGPGLTFENQSSFIRFAFWDLDFYDWNVGSVLRLNSYAQSDTSMRSPIFYDSNDTAYYCDPTGTSLFAGLTVGYGSASSTITMYDSDESSRYIHNNSTTIGFLGSHGGWRFRMADDGNVVMGTYQDWLSNQIRSAIYYDHSDTGYYCDPNGVSKLSGIQSTTHSGNWNTDFQNTPADSFRYGGDLNSGTNCPDSGGWWVQQNFRHSNSTNYWGVQVAWGWEDKANELYTRNVQGGSFGNWIRYSNSNNGGSIIVADLSVSGAAEIASTSCFTDAYKSYHIEFQIVPGTQSAGIYLQFYTGGAWKAANYRTYSAIWNGGGSQGYTPTTYIDIACGGRVRNTYGVAGWGDVIYPTRTDVPPYMFGISGAYDSTVDSGNKVNWGGTSTTTGAITGVRIYASSGTISGYLKIYGRK